MNQWYPLLLDIRDRLCLVVGGGVVSARKIKSLLSSGAKVRAVSPHLCDDIKKIDSPQLEVVKAEYKSTYMNGVALVIASTSNSAVNKKISDEAKKRGIFVNVVDQIEKCSFIVPSVVQRGDLILSISTSGVSPAVSKKLRQDLEKKFGKEWSVYLKMMRLARKLAIEHVANQQDRENIFNALADSELFELVKCGEVEKAEDLVREIVGL